MAPERPVPPEKQLLKLIESQKAKGSTAAIQANAAKHHGLSLFSFGAWLGRFSFFRGRTKAALKGDITRHVDLKMVNAALVAGSCALCAYFVLSIYFSMEDLKKATSLTFKTPESIRKAFVDSGDAGTFTKAASYYLEKISERNIFKMGPRVTAKEAPPEKPPVSQLTEAMANLNLVGISWSSDPDAMVEDKRSGKTFFVKKGQMVGELRVEAIFKDKVILKYGDDEAELK